MEPECPDSPDGYGHHWITERVRTHRGGEPVFAQTCRYCGMSYGEYPNK